MEIINTYQQLMAARAAGLPDVAVNPHYWNGGRDRYRGGWHVYRPGFNLNPKEKNPWSGEANVKVFGVTASREERPALLEQAQEWAAKRYKVTEWKRNARGAYVDVRVQAQFPIRRSPALR